MSIAEDNFLNNKDKRANASLLCALLDEYSIEWRTTNNIHFQVRKPNTDEFVDVWPSTLRVGTVINDQTHFNFDLRRRAIVKFFKDMSS